VTGEDASANPDSPTGRLRVLLLGLLLAGGFVPPASAEPAPSPQAERQIAGIVLQAETRAPISGVTVNAGERRTVTDRDGRFVLRVPTGPVLIEVNAAEFYPLSVMSSDATEIELLLVPRAGFAATVDVSTRRRPPAAASCPATPGAWMSPARSAPPLASARSCKSPSMARQ
jgi:hypothetical protein